MRLTSYTNYSIRILMCCAIRRDEVITIAEIAAVHGISRAHLLKSARRLGQLGYLQTLRGRNGGIRLAVPAAQIDIGEVVRALEDTAEFVECFRPATNSCRIAGACGFSGLLKRSLEAFFREMDGVSLADLVGDGHALRGRLPMIALA